jgi:predicted amidohydrolase
MSSSKPPFRAAVVQTLAVLGDLEANIAIVTAAVEDAVRQNAQLVVLPECMNTGYLFDSADHCRSLAELLDGRYVQALSRLCETYGLHIASGFTERDAETGKVFNSGLLLDDTGALILHYQKQFLATHDQNWFAVGERGCPVVDTKLGRVGLLICFDGRIPEIARVLALQGAEVILDMANFFAMDQADLWVPARAFENGVWFVAATKAGVERSIYYPGGSMIVAPDGSLKARIANDTHGVAVAEVDPGAALRKGWPGGGERIRDRSPGAYALLAEPFQATPLAAQLGVALDPEQATTKAAIVQGHATSTEGSLDQTLDMVDHAAKLGAKLLVLPQHACLSTWLPSHEEIRAAGAATEHAEQRLSQICKRYGCIAVLPRTIASGSGVRCDALLIGPDGGVIGQQSQVHCEPGLPPPPVVSGGFTVFDTPFGRLGVLIGYDGLFPESARVLALQGADIIIWSSAWRHANDRRLLTVPKAEDNRCFLIAANRTDAPLPGGSLIVPPTGFPDWDLDRINPPVTRHNAVMPGFMNLALARQKSMIPGVDMIRNRLTQTYAALAAPRAN